MRIAVDARELAPHPTGVGRYLLELLRAWVRDPDAAGCEVTLYAPTGLDVGDAGWRGPGARVASVPLAGLTGTAWEQLQLPASVAGRADVLFAPAYSAPVFAPVPTVVTVHDVSFFAHPEWFRPREGARRRWTCRISAANAARLLTVSEFSKREMVRWLGVPAERIAVTPHGVSRLAAPVADADTADRAPLVLFVGTQLNRRHLPDLVRAFAPLVARDPRARLVLVGDNRSHPREDARETARQLGIAAAVESRPWISDAELASLYAGATAFAWLSSYEGFGLPPLEAMAAGVPVVAYDTPVAREVYDTAADLVPIGDIDGVTAALGALADPVRRAARRDAGRRLVERYAWDRPARATLAVLREAAS